MPKLPDGLRLGALRELAAANSVREALLVASGRSWHLIVRVGMTERQLLTERGQVRRFGKLETAVGVLRGVGISRITLDAAGFDQDQRQPSLLASSKVPAQQATSQW